LIFVVNFLFLFHVMT